jgi:uncharacterized repeat protein (TIGR01451 family)
MNSSGPSRSLVLLILGVLLLTAGFLGSASAKSLYLVNRNNMSFMAFNVNPDGTITYQTTSSLQYATDPVGVAVDAIPESEAALFITSEFSGVIEYIDARTMSNHGHVFAPGASDLAGIVCDGEHNVVYTVQRSSNILYLYDWNPGAMSLTLRPGFPIGLTGCAGAYGLALDRTAGRLYVADGDASMVRGYDVANWNLVLSYQPAMAPVGIAVDSRRGIVYTSAPDDWCAAAPSGTTILSRYEIATGIERTVDMGHGGMGVAVDEVTGYAYVTAGCSVDDVSVWNTSTSPFTQVMHTQSLGDPAGIACEEGAAINPLMLSLDDGVPDSLCVQPNQALTYSVCYDNTHNPQVPAQNVVLVDNLPPTLSFQSASDGGIYNAGGHSVTWTLGQLPPGAPRDCVQLVTRVQAGVPAGSFIDNAATITGTVNGQPIQTTIFHSAGVCSLQCVVVAAGAPILEGGMYRLPIETPEDLAAQPVYSFQMDYYVDPAFFYVTDASRVGAMTEGQGLFGWRRLPGNIIRVTWAGVNALHGPGVFAYLDAELQPNAPCGQCADLVLQSVMLNEGIPCAQTINGQYCVPTIPMAGHVYYYSCDLLDNSPRNPRPIGDVNLRVIRQCAATVDTEEVVTDPQGAFVLGGCDECDNYVRPSKDRSLSNPEITSWDASLMLRYVLTYDQLDKCGMPAAIYDPTGLGGSAVCSPPGGFTAGVIYDAGWPGNPAAYHILPQRVVGDVSRNGAVTAYDAALVLKYIVGDAMGLASHTGYWDFYCEERDYSPEISITNADFVGLLAGDVSGSWMPGARSGPDEQGQPLFVGQRLEKSGADYLLTLSILDVQGFLSGDFKIEIDPQYWQVLQIQTVGATANFLSEGRTDMGVLRVAMAGSDPAPDGDIVQVRLRKVGNGGTPVLIWAEVNDGSRSVILGLPSDVPVDEPSAGSSRSDFTVQPNPIRGFAELRYRVDQAGPVALELYGTDGRLVRRFATEARTPGIYSLTWDGRGEEGSGTLASGVYFARLRRPGSSEVRRLVLIQ